MATDAAPAAGVTLRQGLVATGIGMMLFASSPVLVANAELNGLTMAWWRAWIAGALYLVVSAIRRNFDLDTVKLTFGSGMAFGLSIGLFFEASQQTSVANTGLIIGLQPLPLLVAAYFLFGERIKPPDIAWMLAAVGGTAVMITAADTSGRASLQGDVLAFGAMLAGGAYFVFSKRARETLDTVPFIAGMMLWGGVVLTPMMLLFGAGDLVTNDGGEWIRILAVALLPGFGHLLINFSHRYVPLMVMGLFQVIVPVAAAVMAWWFLDQSIGIGQSLGIAIVVASLSGHTIYRARRDDSPTTEDGVGPHERSTAASSD